MRTRVETEALAALGERGLAREAIVRLYPALEPQAIDEALDLELQLRRGVRLAA